MQAEPLLALAASIAGEHNVSKVLNEVVGGLTRQPGIAIAGIWLLGPGDICQECYLRNNCADQTECLHLAASEGAALGAQEDWSPLRGQFRRIPKNLLKIGIVATTRNSVFVPDASKDGVWNNRFTFANKGKIRSFVCHPLLMREKVLGVLGVYSGETLQEQDVVWLRMFADQCAVAIANAQAFEALERAQAEAEKHATELRQVLDLAPMHMFIWEANADVSYGNEASREYFGYIPPKTPMEFLELVTHPEDIETLKAGLRQAIAEQRAFASEVRMRRHDGAYRWFQYHLKPLRDKSGTITRWCGTRVDIEEKRQAALQAQNENLVLREEVDRASMFEEIVGTSHALQAVLTRLSKVAPSDSTVLIQGETGTGKELIARAIHKRSRRASRAFVSVNCAAIPKDLIASELFGHEKGAFTGALQRRLGKFELAEGGTIFLDEIGELTLETQVALLRVLQEREFDRVGGSRPIKADVRVLAATHRDLPAAIEQNVFRSDLYYRINVFPIEVPALREREEDIPLLVEYFIDRFSTKMGKKIRRIDKRALDRLRSYPWPGNIRELQNVIERSVIVCETEAFTVDESWLTHTNPPSKPLSDHLVHEEKEMIETALAKAKGRVSGPTGAAMVLGMPPSTLDSKIKALKIDKRRFNRPSA